MADETTTVNPNGVTTDTPAAIPAAKKTRAPRRPKAVAEAASAGVSAAVPETPAKKTRAKRGSKQVAAKAEKSVAEPKKAATRVPRVTKDASAPVTAGDDISNLIKLEEENKQLRKQLSEKLRAENADLRKRLGQA